MRIVYDGPMTAGSVTAAHAHHLRALGHDVAIVDQRGFYRTGRFIDKLQEHLQWGPAVRRHFLALEQAVRSTRAELLITNQYLQPPRAIRHLRGLGCHVAGYSSEYFGYARYYYRHLRADASAYDAVVVTNRLNLPLLRRWGARRVCLTGFGYDPAVHFPVTPSDEQSARYRCDVAFAGHAEPFYVQQIRALKQAGMKVRLCGQAWLKVDFLSADEKLGPLSPGEYRALVASAKIAPTFLSKWNRNTAGGRLFEVAAMRAFLLAEASVEQKSYFAAGSEAEFFETTAELIAKACQFCRDDAARRRIAEAGHRRCMAESYSYRDRVAALVDDLRESLAHDEFTSADESRWA